ncbi:MAG TPA: Nif3-like dinuclear metal center hexameric protein [Halanaerobiales bacterium]|nr:Nif3-like dinuclear metal center hexameric protein [Halanaerobiales bacterium]
MSKIREIIYAARQLAPETLAYDWDNTGLQFGSEEQKVKKALITLDITGEVVIEAIRKNCQLIISHHPLIFSPVKSIDYDSSFGKIIKKIVKNDLAIYAMHSNLDLAENGLNDYLSLKIGLKETQPLKIAGDTLFKLVVYIPLKFFSDVQKAILDTGAGFTGNYSHTSFAVEGKGTFKPLRGSRPFIGREGSMEEVEEKRLETIVKREQLNNIIEVIIEKHPYEEVAYDIYPLENSLGNHGLGRIGYLEKEFSFLEYIKIIKEVFSLKNLNYAGRKDKMIKRVAICSGSGGDLIKTAHKNKADLYITGDVKYHQAQLAEELGLCLIDAGHFETEIQVIKLLKNYFSDRIKDAEFVETEINTNPWNYDI